MNTPTPRSKIILDHIKIYVEADNAAQSYAHYEEVNREIESMERELAAAREELAKAGVGDYKADYFLGELTETGKLRSELTTVTEQRDEARRLAEKYRYLSCDSQEEADATLLPWENNQPKPESKDPHRFCRGGGGNNFHCGCKYDG